MTVRETESSGGVRMISRHALSSIAQLQVGCYCRSRSRSMAAPWIELQIEFGGAAFPLFISAVSPCEAPLQAIYGALFLGKLITPAQPGRSSTHRPTLSHLELELLRHTRSITKWEGVIPRAAPPLHLAASHTGQ